MPELPHAPVDRMQADDPGILARRRATEGRRTGMRRSRVPALLAVGMLVVLSFVTSPPARAQTESTAAAPTDGPSIAWNLSSEQPFAPPTVDADTVLVGGADGMLRALDAATGAERWSATTGPIVSAPVVAGGTVVVGSRAGTLAAFAVATGAEQWSFPTGNAVVASPAVADGTVYAGSSDGALYALDAATGSERWRVPTAGAVESTPAVGAGSVFFGNNLGEVFAVDAAGGAERWRYAMGGLVRSRLGFGDAAGPTVYAASLTGTSRRARCGLRGGALAGRYGRDHHRFPRAGRRSHRRRRPGRNPLGVRRGSGNRAVADESRRADLGGSACRGRLRVGRYGRRDDRGDRCGDRRGTGARARRG